MSEDIDKIKTWIKLKEHFLNEDNIRSVSRLGNKTKIERILGSSIVVAIDYDKIKAILPKD